MLPIIAIMSAIIAPPSVTRCRNEYSMRWAETNRGFVPQRDIIHMELTVYQALDYAAQLRMPQDTTSEERHKRILEVLEELDLVLLGLV